MKKFGFTLAEVLITLGIVGVVAALTAPGLVMSSRNEANAAKLAVVVANIENAFQSAIVAEGVNDLYGTRMWANGAVQGTSTLAARRRFTGELGRYLSVTGTSNAGASPVTNYYGAGHLYPMTTTGQTNLQQGMSEFPTPLRYFPIFLKNGAVMHILTVARPNNLPDEDNIRAQGGSMIFNPADITIDVNGVNGPNTFGRDIFFFCVNEKGTLFPLGGLDVAIADQNNIDSVWNRAGNVLNCTAEGQFGTNVTQRGLGCAARIIEEGYKMNY